MSEFDTKIPTVRKPRLDHLNRQIPPKAHTPMYNWHKFWSRKTWNVVGEFVKTYSKKDEIVLDPFAGSGVTAAEALRNGRRVIACDLLPIATEIIRLTILPVSETKLYDAFKRVESKVKDKILDLYRTKCRKCGKPIPFTCAVWENNSSVEIRYKNCPHCGDRRAENTALDAGDKELLEVIQKREITEWYPDNPLYYPDGQPFKEKQQYESLAQLFTKRNLQALAWLIEAIEEEPHKDLRDFLRVGFTSMVHLSTRMMPDRPTRPFSSVWNEHSYWFASHFMEQNVWELYESAISGKQGILKAKAESNQYFKGVRFAKHLSEVFEGKADVYIHTGSSLELMEKMPKNSVDYIFTDPPYDSSIQYGELAYLWVAWLKKDTGYLESILANEVIHNEKQHKDFKVYHSLLSRGFRDMFDVLKPGRYLTVTFHNPTFRVRNATIRAGTFAGFEFEKIHYQELARSSAKALLQPFGSAQGDFYLRFYKPKRGEQVSQPQEIDEDRFENIVVETTINLLAERAEPTPYTQIINFIDPVLAKNGYFSKLETGLDVKTVLQNHIGHEFKLVKSKIGGASGELWWLTDPARYIKYDVPLSERVEETVYRELLSKGKVTFTQVWDTVSTKFPNSLTSDSSSIMDALVEYGRKVPGSAGYWMLQPEYRVRESQHNEIIALLAEIGRARGFQIWVGKKEQSQSASGLVDYKKLADLVTADIHKIKNINPNNLDAVSQMDLLWVKDNEIKKAFEIEFSTSMTSGLVRGSNITGRSPKYLAIPEERENILQRKQKSPMFSERFGSDGWSVLYFDSVRNAYTKLKKGEIDIDSLRNTPGPKSMRPNSKDPGQMELL